jgi:hypothetical protein
MKHILATVLVAVPLVACADTSRYETVLLESDNTGYRSVSKIVVMPVREDGATVVCAQVKLPKRILDMRTRAIVQETADGIVTVQHDMQNAVNSGVWGTNRAAGSNLTFSEVWNAYCAESGIEESYAERVTLKKMIEMAALLKQQVAQ